MKRIRSLEFGRNLTPGGFWNQELRRILSEELGRRKEYVFWNRGGAGLEKSGVGKDQESVDLIRDPEFGIRNLLNL